MHPSHGEPAGARRPEMQFEASAPTFFADAMLGRLARWLRVLGFDTRTEPELDDHALVRLADAEGRVLLTRDRHLVAELRPRRPLLITEDAPLEQLRQVIQHCGLEPPPALFTRCTVCNTLLVPGTEADRLTLPPKVHASSGSIRRCPTCERRYWPGSHTRRMTAALQRALPEWLPYPAADTRMTG